MVRRDLFKDYLVHHFEVIVWVYDPQRSDQVLVFPQVTNKRLHAFHNQEPHKRAFLLNDMDVFLFQIKQVNVIWNVFWYLNDSSILVLSLNLVAPDFDCEALNIFFQWSSDVILLELVVYVFRPLSFHHGALLELVVSSHYFKLAFFENIWDAIFLFILMLVVLMTIWDLWLLISLRVKRVV